MEPIREAEMQTQPGKRLAEEPKRKKPGKAGKTAAGIVAAAVVVLFCACCMLANSRDTFFPHTTINGVEVGGLTVAEAQSRLEAEIPQRVCKIYLSGQDGVSTEGREPDAVITFAELGLFPESGYEGMAKAPFILQQGKGYLSYSPHLSGSSPWKRYGLQQQPVLGQPAAGIGPYQNCPPN